MTTVDPVEDWAEDFEIFDPEFVKDPYPVYEELRESGCPFAKTERRQTTFMPTTFDAVRQVAGDTENWSSFSVSVTPTPITYDENGDRLRSIITSDAPDHTPERRLMLPFFSPKSVEKYRPHTQELCRRLIREFIEDGEVDAAEQYARQIPPRIIAAHPRHRPGDVRRVHHLGAGRARDRPPGRRGPRALLPGSSGEFFLDEIADRIEHPGDDLISFLLRCRHRW